MNRMEPSDPGIQEKRTWLAARKPSGLPGTKEPVIPSRLVKD